MTPEEKDPPPSERSHTDKSLRSERERADGEYAKTQAAIEKKSDAAIQMDRERADQLSQDARDDLDVKLAKSDVPAKALARVHRERAQEDAALQGERATSDAELQ